jgi:hypothetical protein
MSDDRYDPRVRELTYRLMEMAPDAPPFPEEAAMRARETKSRPPMLVWAGAAVAVVLVVGVPLFLFRGGEGTPDDDVATTIAAPTSTTAPTTTMVEPGTTVTTDLGSTVVPSTSGDCAQDYEEDYPDPGQRDPDTWYVFYGCDRPGMEDILMPRNRSVRSGVIAADLVAAMLGQLEGPSETLRDAGYSAFSVEDFTVQDDGSPDPIVLNLSFPGDVRIDFTDFRFDSGMANASASAASSQLIAQLSSAVFQFWEVETVTFTFDSNCDAFWNWLQRDCTVVTRADWEQSELGSTIAAWLAGEPLSVPTTTEPPNATGTTVLPGEPFDIGPTEGDVVAVVGVQYDDVLWLRDGPGVGYEPLLGLDPLADDVVATGRHRLLESSIWNEVTVDGVTGWVNSSYLGYLGAVEDLTSIVQPRLSLVFGETMVELAIAVGETFAGEESGFRYEISVAPAIGDLGEITVDVLGLADDAQRGWRLHIFGQPAEGGEGFSLKSVEGTAICGRGVTTNGLCV